MIPTLGRGDASEAGVSLVPLTLLELVANVHKSAVRSFFTKNFFMDLATGDERLGLPDAGTASLPDENRNALELVQKLRNQFLGRAANLSGGIASFDGSDPMPKAILRSAAQLDKNAGWGEWYDTRNGLELLYDELRSRRVEPHIKGLYEKISVRRKGRGHSAPLSDRDQLILAEILFDVAAQVSLEPIVVWEIRIGGRTFGTSEVEGLREAIRAVAPDATFIEARSGSIILRYRSPVSRYLTLQMLLEKRVLQEMLRADTIEMRRVSDEGSQFKQSDEIDYFDLPHLVLSKMQAWRPSSEIVTGVDLEEEVLHWLRDTLSQLLADGYRISRHVRFRHGDRKYQPDIVIAPPAGFDGRVVAVEVSRFRSRRHFFDMLARCLELPIDVILVVAGAHEHMDVIDEVNANLLQTSGSVKVVAV
ncbi:hypothetical protein [Sphingobium yanoikuyae]|uniref:hypothetical protein n=1 Tax=Sphingobium yanoikuyae TaxID=13690 RepID=UPI0028B0D0AD|nr:hypothetical protein [Sphingobium yanoikuyae]